MFHAWPHQILYMCIECILILEKRQSILLNWTIQPTFSFSLSAKPHLQQEKKEIKWNFPPFNKVLFSFNRRESNWNELIHLQVYILLLAFTDISGMIDDLYDVLVKTVKCFAPLYQLDYDLCLGLYYSITSFCVYVYIIDIFPHLDVHDTYVFFVDGFNVKMK